MTNVSLTTRRIAALNDACRKSGGADGRLLMTKGIAALPRATVELIRTKLVAYDDFTPDNDPYHERDFGSFQIAEGYHVFWKIDCYDRDLEYGSPDPADPDLTTRVLTLMLAEEY